MYDVAVVGAGAVGCAIARELTLAGARCALLDAANDVGTGTSKANTAILHAGFDAPVGSVEARLVARGRSLLRRHAARTGIPTEDVGALLVAWTGEQAAALPGIAAKARANGYDRVATVERDELYALEPALGDGALAALSIPDESIVCPWTTTIALATEAVENGCALLLGSRVAGVDQAARQTSLEIEGGDPVTARWVVNAAGLASDDVHRLFGRDDFRIRPRRGQLLVFDKLARPLVSSIILPVPTPATKGVLVAPTVYGNVLLGPTAEDVRAKDDRDVTAEGVSRLLDAGRRILPGLLEFDVVAAYAGVRAASEPSGYQLGSDPAARYAWAGGIRSTGISACMAIAEWVREALPEDVLGGRPVRPRPAPRMPPIGEAQPRPYASPDAIARDPGFGRVVCFCERVTRAEVVAAARSTVPATDLDGVRRRTRATMGRCQGFYCAASVGKLLDEARR